MRKSPTKTDFTKALDKSNTPKPQKESKFIKYRERLAKAEELGKEIDLQKARQILEDVINQTKSLEQKAIKLVMGQEQRLLDIAKPFDEASKDAKKLVNVKYQAVRALKRKNPKDKSLKALEAELKKLRAASTAISSNITKQKLAHKQEVKLAIQEAQDSFKLAQALIARRPDIAKNLSQSLEPLDMASLKPKSAQEKAPIEQASSQSYSLDPFLYICQQDSRLCYLNLIYKHLGHASESIPGLANFCAELINEGLESSMREDLELEGISMHAQSSLTSLKLSFTFLKSQAPILKKALIKLYKNFQSSEKAISSMKTRLLGELAALGNNYDYQARRLLDSHYFQEPCFQTGILGDAKSLKSIELKDVNAFLKRLKASSFTPSLAGKLTSNELSSLDKVLKKLSGEKAPKAPKKPYETNKSSFHVSKKAPVLQSYIYFALPLNIDFKDPKYPLLKVAAFIFGAGGFGSRLMDEIRVKQGLAYSVYAYADISLGYSRLFGYMQTRCKNTKQAIASLKSLLKAFIEKGVSQSELEAAITFMQGSEALNYETAKQCLNMAILEDFHSLKLGFFKELTQMLKDIELDELNAFIKTLPQDLRIAVLTNDE